MSVAAIHESPLRVVGAVVVVAEEHADADPDAVEGLGLTALDLGDG